MTNYVYKRTENSPPLYTVGFYTPNGKWVPESDWSIREAAAKRVHYLNGGSCDEVQPRGDSTGLPL